MRKTLVFHIIALLAPLGCDVEDSYESHRHAKYSQNCEVRMLIGQGATCMCGSVPSDPEACGACEWTGVDCECDGEPTYDQWCEMVIGPPQCEIITGLCFCEGVIVDEEACGPCEYDMAGVCQCGPLGEGPYDWCEPDDCETFNFQCDCPGNDAADACGECVQTDDICTCICTCSGIDIPMSMPCI
jgi:hypothetical protein